MKCALGFKDDRMIDGHQVIKRGTTWWGVAMIN
jgi:hypothetical protein